MVIGPHSGLPRIGLGNSHHQLTPMAQLKEPFLSAHQEGIVLTHGVAIPVSVVLVAEIVLVVVGVSVI